MSAETEVPFSLPACPRCGKTTWSTQENEAVKNLYDLTVELGKLIVVNHRTVDSDIIDSFIFCRSCSFGSQQSVDTKPEEIELLQAIADELEEAM